MPSTSNSDPAGPTSRSCSCVVIPSSGSGIGGIFGGGDFDPPQLGGCRSGRSQIAPIEGQSDDRSCQHRQPAQEIGEQEDENRNAPVDHVLPLGVATQDGGEVDRSEEHTSELQSLMRISYAVFCLK